MLLHNQYIKEKKFLNMKTFLIQMKRKITLVNQRYIIRSCTTNKQTHPLTNPPKPLYICTELSEGGEKKDPTERI